VHCAEFAAATWPVSSAKTRLSVIETPTRVVPVVVSDQKGAPDSAVLRSALRKTLNQGGHAGEPDEDEVRAAAWIARVSRPVGSLVDPAVVCDILDASRSTWTASPRPRSTFPAAPGHAPRPGVCGPQEKADGQPAVQAQPVRGVDPPQAPDDTLDPRSVGSPALVAAMLQTCKGTGSRQGRRFAAFDGCMFYAMMRPSEVAALTRSGCELPERGWGHLMFADASPARPPGGGSGTRCDAPR
jgi:hypothetical protein